MSASPGSWSASSAATPPRRARRSGGSTGASASRVDGAFERQPPRVSFIDDDRAETTAPLSPVSWRDDDASNNTTATGLQPCSYCHQTRRLRTALKRIEEDYVGQIASLQARLHEAVVQRAAAEQERNELLVAADAAAATGAPMMAQTLKSLQVEAIDRAQENAALRRRVQHLELEQSAACSRQLAAALQSLTQTEAELRAGTEASAHETAALLYELWRIPPPVVVVERPVKSPPTSHTPGKKAAETTSAAEAEVGGLCSHLSLGFSPDSSSPGPSEGSRERRTSSPRPSQRRSLSVPLDSQRLSYSPRAHELQLSATNRSVTAPRPCSAPELDAAAVEVAVQARVKKLEWSMQQQRSAYEMELADERALTKEMQEEVDDLVENELVLLETCSRAALEREAAELLCESVVDALRQQRCRTRASTGAGANTCVDKTSASTQTSVMHGCVAPEARDGERVVDVAALREAREAAVETRRVVADLRSELAGCHATVGALGPRHAALEELLRQVLDTVTAHARQGEGTRTALRRFSHVSTHNDEALMRSLQRLETCVKARAAPASSGATQHVDPSVPAEQPSTTADAAAVVVSPHSAVANRRGSSSSGSSEVVLSACTPDSPVSVPAPSTPAARASFVVPEEALFNPTAITVDTRAAAATMASFLGHDALSDASDDDVARNPYEFY